MPKRDDPLAQALHRQRTGDVAEAERLCRGILSRTPSDGRALLLLGTLKARQGALAEAVPLLERAVAERPDDAAARINLGSALHQAGRGPDAVAHLQAAVRLAPADPAARNALGAALKAGGDPAGAAAAFQAAIAIHPDYVPARINLGNLLRDAGRFAAAAAQFSRAAEAEPGNADLLYRAGTLRRRAGDLEGAVAAIDRAAALRPDRYDIRKAVMFLSCYRPDRTPEQVFRTHRDWGADHMARCATPAAPLANRPDPERRLRVGYLSPDLYHHAVSHFIAPMLAHHDRDRVEVTCYANVRRPDAVTERLKSQAGRWRDVFGLDDAAVAGAIRDDGIDVLVELAGHSGNGRLSVLALRPAPVQVSYLGYPATTGLPTVDWRLTDAVCDPPGTEAWYTERLHRIDAPFCAYAAPADAPPVAPLPAASGPPTFGSLLNLLKINDAALALWARVLDAVPGSRLLIFRDSLAEEETRSRLRAALQAHGVPPDRVLLEWQRPASGHYLDVYGRIDIALDTVPFCGHTSTCEALWMGVPTVTLAGQAFAGRMGASLNRSLGLADLVAGDADGFVAAAASLAADRDRLAHLRATARDRMRNSPLLDGEGFSRRLEAAYRALWRDWCAARSAGP